MTSFEETKKSYFKRIEDVLKDLLYITSQVKFSKDEFDEAYYIKKFGAKLEEVGPLIEAASKSKTE